MNNELVVVGSVAFDTIENANGRAERVLGGAASYASICASYFASPAVVAVVGTDFTAQDKAPFIKRKVNLKGLEVRNVPMKYNSNVGIYITRSKHIFLEQINSHHNQGAGFFVNEKNTGSGGGHYFLNCDSHDNYDPNGRQGDGEEHRQEYGSFHLIHK